MAQSDYELAAHISGLNQRTEINSIFDSILTHNSGSTAPTVTKAFMMWVDTSNATYYYLKMRNHDNTAWVALFIYTVSTKVITPFIINSPTTNAIPKINADGTIGNSNIINDANGNTGLGVTPSTFSQGKSNEFGFLGNSIWGNTSSDFEMLQNAYYNGGYKYANSGISATKYTQINGVHTWGTAPSGTAGNAVTWTNVMTLDTNGRLDVNPIGNSGAFRAYTTGTSNINYASTSSQVASTNWFHFYGLSSNGTVTNIAIYGNGNVQNANNSYGSISDVKLKENIVDTSPKLDKLMQVRVVNYNLIGDEQKQIGVIAQEIEKIFPSVVEEIKDTKQVEITKTIDITDEEGNTTKEEYTEIETIETGKTTKSVKYSIIYMMMLKGMQEQQEIINDLKARIEILENK